MRKILDGTNVSHYNSFIYIEMGGYFNIKEKTRIINLLCLFSSKTKAK